MIVRGGCIVKLAQFNPPAKIDDLGGREDLKKAWSTFISGLFDDAIQRTEQEVGSGKSQFYNPTKADTETPFAAQDISWIGFPKLIRDSHANAVDAWKEADTPVTSNGQVIRVQDEYLEWFVTRDPATSKIRRVTFTCEGPEYWQFLAERFPEKAVELYRKYISPDVQQADLFGPTGRYNRWNRWNSERGAMHLNQPNNTLSAEIAIAADATVLRKGSSGQTLTDADDLIRCARYGEPGRASDPVIGAAVNRLARDGHSITLQDPVGLYISGIDMAGFTKPNGDPADSRYWTVLRGSPGMILRAQFEVPDGEGFLVGDLTIGGRKIGFGGQIAEHITVKLTGLACRRGQSHNLPANCVPGGVGVVGPASLDPEQVTTRLRG
jgi:hypothetical protein